MILVCTRLSEKSLHEIQSIPFDACICYAQYRHWAQIVTGACMVRPECILDIFIVQNAFWTLSPSNMHSGQGPITLLDVKPVIPKRQRSQMHSGPPSMHSGPPSMHSGPSETVNKRNVPNAFWTRPICILDTSETHNARASQTVSEASGQNAFCTSSMHSGRLVCILDGHYAFWTSRMHNVRPECILDVQNAC